MNFVLQQLSDCGPLPVVNSDRAESMIPAVRVPLHSVGNVNGMALALYTLAVLEGTFAAVVLCPEALMQLGTVAKMKKYRLADHFDARPVVVPGFGRKPFDNACLMVFYHSGLLYCK